MHNKINNVSIGGNIECSFVKLGISEKLKCIYSACWSPRRHASVFLMVGWFDAMEAFLCLKHLRSFINKKCDFSFSDEAHVLFSQ
jgi:hypothetical protein